MKQSLDDIADLAEDLGNRYLHGGKVDLEKIASSKGIAFVHGNYGEYFLGQLVHLSKKFYIILNDDLLRKSESGRIRFTVAHELGHYFIDGHRTQLAKGVSLSFKGDYGSTEGKKIETAANHFAANLLMPKGIFIQQASNEEPGLAAVYAQKKIYDTSIESTATHYIKLNIVTAIMIKWKPDFTYHYASYSTSFSMMTGIRGVPPIKFNSDYVKQQVSAVGSGAGDYIECATPLSRWISSIAPGSSKDFMGLEQTMKLGDYGGFTLLTFIR